EAGCASSLAVREKSIPSLYAYLHNPKHRRKALTTKDTKVHEGNLVRDHSLYFRCVCIADQHGAAKPALSLLIFGGQDVTQKSVRSFDLSTGGLLEALGGAFVCFQFWHDDFQLSIQRSDEIVA